ncbi:MAG TPA: hypothetical protein VHA75_18480, partial [Rugosimonospora sp.]|nr:hypothetical protein [Rugosimonospora sp.]
AARDAARDAAWATARDAAWDAAWATAGATAGLLVRDLIDDATYRTLTWPLAGVLGPLHPDDDPVPVCVHEDGWEHPAIPSAGAAELPCPLTRPTWLPA